MSYGDEPTVVDLGDMHVICLSGENGHGKSALLDAITWALWGETRLGKQSHDQLVRIGADEMSVSLRFRNGEQVCRVRRQRSRKSSGNIWELQLEEPGGTLRPLTGQGSSDTGRAIVDLLRMSYDTFLNSAYLRQGRADEFVRQTANKRKELLAEILDLSRYDKLESHARAKSREAADRALDEDRAINSIDAELAAASGSQDRLSETDAQIAVLTDRRRELNASLDQINERRSALVAQRARLAEFAAQLQSLKRANASHLEQCRAEQTAIDDATRLLAERPRIEQALARRDLLLKLVERLQSDAQQFRVVDARRLRLELAVESARRDLERSLTAAEREQFESAKNVESLTKLAKEIDSLTAALSQSASLDQRQQLETNELQDLRTRFADLASDHKRATSDLGEARARLERILEQDEVCSVCGSPLPDEKLAALAETCEIGIVEIQTRLDALAGSGKNAKLQISRLDLSIKDRDAELRRLQDARIRLAQLQQQADTLRERQAADADLRASIALLRRNLQTDAYAQTERVELASIAPELAHLAAAEDGLGCAQEELRALRAVESESIRLQNARRELDAAQSRLSAARLLAAETDGQIERLNALCADAPQIERRLADNQAERDRDSAAAAVVAADLQRAERERGRLQNIIERSSAISGQRIVRLAALQAARNDEELYTLLAGSFSKRGVQALIIENALPELENDANDLLQRLTDGQMTLTLQTTRQTKSRSAGDAPIETLDVTISDSLGSRPLELYSGGESFRISFALRIALSKLLARHAGAQLQTLIIDEGFGTQDARGREKLVDAIMTIQSDFAQIIVITHVDEIKDAFANRIEVFKTPAGSEVNLVVGAALG